MWNPFKRSEKPQEVLILKPGGELVVNHTVTHRHLPRPRPVEVWFKVYNAEGQTWQLPGFRMYGQNHEMIKMPTRMGGPPPMLSDWDRVEMIFNYGDS